MYEFLILDWYQNITKWKLFLYQSYNDPRTCLPFLGSAYGGHGSRYSDGRSPTPLPHHHWSLLLSPQTQHKSSQNSCQIPSSFLLSKRHQTKVKNSYTEHALQGGKKVIYNLSINIFKLIYGLKLLVFKHYIALGGTWMEYNVPVCEINAVIAVSVVTGESDLDLGSEVSSEESSIYK